jgi:hypothetical protein
MLVTGTQKMKLKAFLTLALTSLSSASFADTTSFNPLTSLENTKPHEVVAETTRYNGFDSIKVQVSPDHKSIEEDGCDNCTFLEIGNTNFKNGTIELEVASHPIANPPKWARGFVGIVFRAQDKKYEGIYLRPLNSIENNQLQRNHTIQYFSYPDHPWHVLRKETPGKYESYAPLEPGKWTHMRIDVEDETAKLYLNHHKQPSLIVTDLKHGSEQKGFIGLFTEPATVAYYRNLTLTHRK